MNNLDRLIEMLCSERNEKAPDVADSDKWRLFRALVNVREPRPIDEEFLQLQDEYLQEQLKLRGITDIDNLTPIAPDLYLWQGDITTLKCDGIVNAANSALLGCFCPNHGCIDNAIHTYSGVQLRLECAEIVRAQGREERTGQAKITRAYNLPCKYVIHTVGPIVYGGLNAQHERLLSDCYINCLKLADKRHLRSIAFCCISTGEFHFPNERAAEIAIRTVNEYKRSTNSSIKVVFNVFKDYDYEIYNRLLTAN